MTSAYILIAAILVLGGLLAALGDRLGSKVGKARLRLFNLRPRQTAIVVTVVTGVTIASSTLGILFALSKSLRQGIFELDDILKKRREVTAELEKVTNERNTVQQELSQARSEQKTVQEQLTLINQNFQQATVKLQTVSKQAQRLRSDIKTLVSDRQKLVAQKTQLGQQITQLQTQVSDRDRELSKQEQQLSQQDNLLEERRIRLQELETQKGELQTEIDRRDGLIMQLDKAIADKDWEIKEQETQVRELEAQKNTLESQRSELESQLTFLRREVDVLEQYYQTYQELREKKIAIVRGQVLAFAALRIVDPNAVVEAIDELLRQANRTAIEATRTNSLNNRETDDSNERVVRITKAQVEQLIAQIQDGQDYVVRIISAGNYVQGETEVRVFADVALNQKIFDGEDTIATVSIDGAKLTEEDLQKRLDLLLAASQFRARRAGILGTIQVEDGRIKTVLDFIEEVSASGETIDEIKALASEQTYSSGPLKLHLVAIRNGKVVFST